MAFFCAGSSGEARKKAQKGSKPAPNPNKTSSNGRPANPFQDVRNQPLPNIPHAKSVDLPHSRKLIVLQEFKSEDNRELTVMRGESVQVINQEGNWLFVRNERGKEGFVPSTHLVAPYSSTRSRKGTLTSSNPIRPVASGSSINDMDPPGRAVPMYPSHSAGRPRNLSSGDENRVNGSLHGIQRVVSPQIVLSQNDMNGSSLSQGMMSSSAYEQKYSPSSSSGVASMNGPSSPSFQSTSQENVRNGSSASSLTHEQCSLSSNEERPHSLGINGTAYTNGHGFGEEDRMMRNGRTPLESNMNHTRGNPDRQSPNMYRSTPSYHIYHTLSNEAPPPIPPRMMGGQTYSASQGDQYYSDHNSNADSAERYEHQTRVRSLTDVRLRDTRQQPMYAEVYKKQDHSGMNGMQGMPGMDETNGIYHRLDHAPSEGGSSRRSSSKHSSRSSNRTPKEGGYDSQEIVQKPDTYHHQLSQSSQTKIAKFRKCLWGVFVVTHDFEAYDENEVSVRGGDHVSVWNQDDNEWFWIVKHTSAEEGFVPSCYLREIVASDTQHMPVSDVSSHNTKPPPLPPKQHQLQQHNYHTTQHYRDDSARYRQRAHSGESRAAMIVRRPSAGGSDRSRGRLNSDGSSTRSSVKGQASSSSIEKTGIPESPPNSPPPPYSEYDQQSHQPTRHYSLSQQPDPSPAAYSTHMQRTHSYGHDPHPHRQRQGKGNRPHPLPAVNGGRRHDERLTSPAEMYALRSPTVMPGGGTLV